MLIRKPPFIRESQVTPQGVYLNRRRFLAGTLALPFAASAQQPLASSVRSPFSTSEPATPLEAVTGYNNFYEFGTGKDQPAKFAGRMKTYPWSITVEGAGAKKQVFDIERILKLAPIEERIYRLRCVEGWSMVIPWLGYPLAGLLKQAGIPPKAKYVAFESYYSPGVMPQSRFAGIAFPYVEGLRLDEAMHPLTLLTLGLYGRMLPNQNGALVRIVVPWKYGFKSIKSIVKIRFAERQPASTWSLSAPQEYGFYSNVNPDVDHPRWSQKKERRIGEFFKRDTIRFNGYGEHVAPLYAGMDLRRNY